MKRKPLLDLMGKLKEEEYKINIQILLKLIKLIKNS